MRRVNKLPTKIAIAIIVGLVFAGATSKITYTCTPIDGAQGCVSVEKAVMHPRDLLSNKQNSLTSFSTTFVVSSLLIFAFLGLWDVARTKQN